MNMQAKSQKNGHLIATGGMVVALLSFFLIPFVTMSMPNPSPLSQPRVYSETFSALQSASFQGFIWLDALLAGVILLLALLLAFSRNPFDMSQVPLNKQVQWGIYAIIGVSVVSLLLQFIIMNSIPGSLVGMFSSPFFGSSGQNTFLSGVSMSYSIGSWLYLVGMLAAIGGEIYAYRATLPAAAVPAQVSSPYMTPPSWQQPNQTPAQYPPQQYPPAQYPPAQNQPQQYPPQQYPPAQYPPTQYPPAQ